MKPRLFSRLALAAAAVCSAQYALPASAAAMFSFSQTGFIDDATGNPTGGILEGTFEFDPNALFLPGVVEEGDLLSFSATFSGSSLTPALTFGLSDIDFGGFVYEFGSDAEDTSDDIYFFLSLFIIDSTTDISLTSETDLFGFIPDDQGTEVFDFISGDSESVIGSFELSSSSTEIPGPGVPLGLSLLLSSGLVLRGKRKQANS